VSRAQVELRESVLELSAESAELVECLAKDAVGLVGLVRLAGLVGHHQIKNENATFQTSNQCIPTFKQRRDELYLVSQGTILLELWKMCVWLKNINGNKWLRK